MRRPTLEAAVAATREVAAVAATREAAAGAATPEEGAGATSEEEATSRAAGTPWAVARPSADIWAAVTPLPGTLPGLISPAAPARRPTTRPCMGVSRTPARCTRPLATRVAGASYTAGGAGTPGAVATGM